MYDNNIREPSMLYHVLNKTIKVALDNYHRQQKHTNEIKEWLIVSHIKKVPYVREFFFKKVVTRSNFYTLHSNDCWDYQQSIFQRIFNKQLSVIHKNHPLIVSTFFPNQGLIRRMELYTISSLGHCSLHYDEVQFVKDWVGSSTVVTVNTMRTLKIND